MKNGILIIIVLAVLMVSQGGVYVINEAEQAIVTQFGKPVSDVVSSGLHFKLPPFVQNVNRFENRILKWDGDPNQIPTKDKKFIWVDTTARWRIKDPLLFSKPLPQSVVPTVALMILSTLSSVMLFLVICWLNLFGGEIIMSLRARNALKLMVFR